jgi:hypothetical protein
MQYSATIRYMRTIIYIWVSLTLMHCSTSMQSSWYTSLVAHNKARNPHISVLGISSTSRSWWSFNNGAVWCLCYASFYRSSNLQRSFASGEDPYASFRAQMKELQEERELLFRIFRRWSFSMETTGIISRLLSDWYIESGTYGTRHIHRSSVRRNVTAGLRYLINHSHTCGTMGLTLRWWTWAIRTLLVD